MNRQHLLACLLSVSSLIAEDIESVLPPLVVSASRVPDREFNAYHLPAKITVITRQDIENSGARTVQEALETQAGVSLYDSIGNSHQKTFDMRGFNTQPVSGTSVFVDGIRVNEPDFNEINFHLIPLDQVERIEVIPGSSAIYGRNSLAGALNIITKRGGDKSRTSISAAYGSFDRQRYTVSSGGPLGDRLDYQMAGSRELTDGYRDDAGARISQFFGKWGWTPNDLFDLQLSYTHTNSFLEQAGSIPRSTVLLNPTQNLTPGDFLDSELNRVGLHGKLTPFDSLTITGILSHRDHLRTTRINGLSSTTEAVIDSAAAGAVVQATHEAEIAGRLNVFTTGIEFTNHNVNSTATNVFSGFAFPSSRLTNGNVFSAYAQDSFDILPTIVVTGSVRFDRDDLEFTDRLTATKTGRTFEEVTPRVGLVYKAHENFSVFVSYSEGFQTPTADQLFAFAGTSNPDLKPISTQNYETGVRGHWKWVSGSLTLFQINGDNEIGFNPTIQPFGQNQNLGDTQRRGVEFEMRAQPWKLLGGSVNYSYTDATFDSQFVLSSGVDFSNITIQKGDRLPLVPQHRLGVGLHVTPTERCSLSLNGVYQSDIVLVGDEGNDFGNLGGYFTLNARASYSRDIKYGRLSAFVSVNNALDRDYQSFGIYAGSADPFVVPGQEVSVTGGLQFEF